MKPKAYIKTYGCQMNEHDTFQMRNVLEAEGYAMTDAPEEAALILLNTCSVRQNPENKVYSFLGRIREVKEANPEVIVAVGGCVAQQEGKTILKREKAVDLVFGPDTLFKLPEMLAEVKTGARVCHTEWMPRERKIQNFIPERWVEQGHVEGIKAYISITKGCNNMCTFCIVPTTRGREVSREKDNILLEARALAERGAKELWLLGQNVNSYRSNADYRFYELLDELSQVEGIRRIRFTSPHPKDWSNELSDLMASRKTICNQLHLPFQAGSDRILEAMRRNHTLDEYLEKVAYLQQVAPTVELSTDLIVGFPGETEEDFERTLHCLRVVRFNQLFPFKYSQRPGTPAAAMVDDVPREVKDERLARVIALQEEITELKQHEYIGRIEEVLIDAAHARQRGWMNGRTDGFKPITIEDATAEIGDMVHARVTGHRGHWLVGERVEAPEPALA
jgi:tRNA-2-methylthio-N6-dimethylallyladenosine synthase